MALSLLVSSGCEVALCYSFWGHIFCVVSHSDITVGSCSLATLGLHSCFSVLVMLHCHGNAVRVEKRDIYWVLLHRCSGAREKPQLAISGSAEVSTPAPSWESINGRGHVRGFATFCH